MGFCKIDNSTRHDMLVGSLLPEQTVQPALQLEVHTRDVNLERIERNTGSRAQKVANNYLLWRHTYLRKRCGIFLFYAIAGISEMLDTYCLAH